MCTMIALKIPVTGGGKGPQGWFPVREAIVGYDHTTYMKNEHALLLDFVNPDLEPSARVAVELDIASGKASSPRFRPPSKRPSGAASPSRTAGSGRGIRARSAPVASTLKAGE